MKIWEAKREGGDNSPRSLNNSTKILQVTFWSRQASLPTLVPSQVLSEHKSPHNGSISASIRKYHHLKHTVCSRHWETQSRYVNGTSMDCHLTHSPSKTASSFLSQEDGLFVLIHKARPTNGSRKCNLRENSASSNYLTLTS